jgi:anhydro-N-acetylmuramic acid kinase
MAVGGQGAPLIAYVDRLLFQRESENVAVQNIGGIANVTFVPATQGQLFEERPEGSASGCFAFDTGPGNMVIDSVVSVLTGGAEEFDKDGRRVARGKVIPGLLDHLMSHSFLDKVPPKSTGREEFGEQFAAKLVRCFREDYPQAAPEDLVATVTCFTAASIADAYRRFFPQPVAEVIVGGGGVFNPTLLRFLRQELSTITISRHRDHGIPDEAKEALGFALLARETLAGKPANVPGATGAEEEVVLGSITPGAGSNTHCGLW